MGTPRSQRVLPIVELARTRLGAAAPRHRLMLGSRAAARLGRETEQKGWRRARPTHLLRDLGPRAVGRVQHLLAAGRHRGVGRCRGAAAKAQAGEEGEHGAGGGHGGLGVALLQGAAAAVCRAVCTGGRRGRGGGMGAVHARDGMGRALHAGVELARACP